MITKQDLLEAIAECQGTRSPNSNTAIKLAAFYTILDHLEDADLKPSDTPVRGYSFASSDALVVNYGGDSDFAATINGKLQSDVWPVMDELMSAVRVMNTRLYDGVMRKLQ